uniref:IP04031p n=1 Tax=Drosophila melanogaster TaxID=7227 RepID=Q4V4G9_DROME|nr:IP04031p [Drosophila melanogaster]
MRRPPDCCASSWRRGGPATRTRPSSIWTSTRSAPSFSLSTSAPSPRTRWTNWSIWACPTTWSRISPGACSAPIARTSAAGSIASRANVATKSRAAAIFETSGTPSLIRCVGCQNDIVGANRCFFCVHCSTPTKVTWLPLEHRT